LSIAISPILATIIVWALEPITGGKLRKCPYCTEMIKSEATHCRHCRKELPKIKIETKAREYWKRKGLYEVAAAHKEIDKYDAENARAIKDEMISRGLLAPEVKKEEPTEKTCPYCAETIKIAAKVYRYCNRDLPSADPHPTG